MNSILDLLKKLNIVPKNKELYYTALTHPSFANEKRFSTDYQRLEFLGDAMLSKAAALKVFTLYPKLAEGKMTIIRSNSVSGKTLASFSRELGLNKLLRVGNNGEDLKENEKVLADIFEAFVCAIFLDQGEERFDEFLDGYVYKFIKNSKGQEIKNPKTLLQEFLQAESREIIEYETSSEGDEFKTKVLHDKHTFGIGVGKTKKESEISAAENALKKLSKGKKWN